MTMNWLQVKPGSKVELNGIWLVTGSYVIAEIAARAGFDWALFDLEHGLGAEADILRQVGLFAASAPAPLVRVPAGRPDLVLRALDAGAAGIMIPRLQSAEQAHDFVRSLRYPPQGTRGLSASSRAAAYGSGFAGYLRESNTRVTGIVQIENAEALRQAEAMAAIPGVDVLFIGHSDLSIQLGCFEDFNAPAMLEAEEKVVAACRKHGKRAGMLLKSSMPIAAYRAKGFSFFGLGTDASVMRRGFGALVDLIRAPGSGAHTPSRP